MKLKFNNLDIFIKKYYISFCNLNVEISLDNLIININFLENDKNNFGIIVGNQIIFDERFKNVNDKIINKSSIKLLELLNNNLDVPLSIKLKKKVNYFTDTSIFLISSDGIKGDLSKGIINILNYSSDIYTNNIEGLKLLLIELNITNKNIYNFKNIKEINNDLVLFNYGDYFEGEREINKVLMTLYKNFTNIYISPNSTNFINKYSLSHTNYGSLLFLGTYNIKENVDFKEKLLTYLNNSNKITSTFSIGEMISLSGFSMEFLYLSDLVNFTDSISDIGLNDKYLFELIYETDNGYYNLIDYLDDIDYSFLEDKVNTSNITIFIYPKVGKQFIGYNKLNSKESTKKITYLSSPLSNKDEFTFESVDELIESKYIFGESISGVRKFLDNLKINTNDKNILYGEDIEGINEYINENDLYNKNKIDLVGDVFPELIKILENGEKIHLLSDGGAPCILDPGDNIKKYINLYYPDYSVIGIKGPNVISTILLSCVFNYKYIYWAPLIYTIYPAKEYLKKTLFFDNTSFQDTIIIFYSFGRNIEQDIDLFIELMGKNTTIQIIGDIGRKKEYNKHFGVNDIGKVDINYVSKNINNIVYILRINNED